MNDFNRIRHKINSLPHYCFPRCNRPDIKVACILDPFSFECFKYECSLEQLRLETWDKQMQTLKPRFLFVESAWRGVDNSWQNVLTKKSYEIKKGFINLIAYCKENKVTTIFWNKEDPSNYVHFIDTAKYFDFIFTTDKDCIEKYIKDVGHKRVYTLSFAAQPVIHNPVKLNHINKGSVAFAGTWYGAKHIERQKDMHIVLDPARDFGLHIFDRMYSFTGNLNYKFPVEYQSHIIGELNYNDMIKAYKLYKVFLNVNSVKGSPTMFSRRVFEILASGTNLVTTYSRGIEEMFGSLVSFTSSREETIQNLSILLSNPEHSERLSLLGLRTVHAKHLYKHRFNTILEKIGIVTLGESTVGVSIITCLNNEQSIESLMEIYQSQTLKNKELIIILKQSQSAVPWNAETNLYSNVSIFVLPEDQAFDDCLNFAVKKTKYNYFSVFYENNYYGPNFLTDLMNAFSYTDADIIGKGCYYTYYESTKLLVLKDPDQVNRFVSFLPSTAMIVKKDSFDRMVVPQKSNFGSEEFFTECVKRGFLIYSADKYNFVQRLKHSTLEENDKFIAKIDAYNYRGYVII